MNTLEFLRLKSDLKTWILSRRGCKETGILEDEKFVKIVNSIAGLKGLRVEPLVKEDLQRL